MAPSPDPRRLGLPRSARDDHGAAFYLALPREALQLRLSGLPQSGRSGRHLEIAKARGNRSSTHGRLHDGSRSQRQRTGLPTSRLHLFLRRRHSRIAIACLPPALLSLIEIPGASGRKHKSWLLFTLNSKLSTPIHKYDDVLNGL